MRPERDEKDKIALGNIKRLVFTYNNMRDLNDVTSNMIVMNSATNATIEFIGNTLSSVTARNFMVMSKPYASTSPDFLYMRNNTWQYGGARAFFNFTSRFTYDVQYNTFYSLLSFLGEAGSTIFEVPETTTLGPAIIRRNVFDSPSISNFIIIRKYPGTRFYKTNNL
jgi:hypothetical protein